MGENNPRLNAFEARLAEMRRTMEAGLGERAGRVEGHLQRLATAAEAAREGLRQEAHKLRGVAGTFGHGALGELAGGLEQVALSGSPEAVTRLAEALIAAVRAAGTEVGRSVPAAAPTEIPHPTAVTATSSTRAVRRVLAIDDDPETRTLLTLTLRQMGGFDAVIVVCGADALERLTHERFDLVLCDAMMPDMNGLTLCQRARQLSTGHPPPPIVILSAATSDELGWNVDTDHAPFAWWRKPFKPKQLIEQINTVLDTR